MICRNQKLAKTSGSPGKTQLINHFNILSSPAEGSKETTRWYLVDLPGYGFAKVSINQRRQWEKMIENYLRKRENLGMVFVLIDSRHSPQAIDLEFINQLGEWEVPFTLIFTKSDKEIQRVVSKNVRDFLDAMRETWQFLPAHVVTSAIKGTGRKQILDMIAESNSSFEERR